MKPFAVNIQNIKQTTAIHLTFISEEKLQKEQFLAKYDCSFYQLMRSFRTPVRMGMCISIAQLKN